MDENENVKWLFPLLVGYVPSGIAYGVLATAIHIPWYFTLSLSLIVYSGAVQSAFIGFWSIGFDPLSLIFTAFLLNLRHSVYGPHLEEEFNHAEKRDVFSLGPFLTDEVYALGVGTKPMTLGKLRNISILGYFLWFGSTSLGIIFTGGIPGYLLPTLYLALPALFLALMVPRVKGAGTLIAATISVVVSVTFKLEGFPDYLILVPILLGLIGGILASSDLRRLLLRISL